MKLVIVGGGSSYTPELVAGLMERVETFPVSEICLTDINPQRLQILHGLAQRMVAKVCSFNTFKIGSERSEGAGTPIRVTMTEDRKAALEGASFVNCLIRVGGMDARILDERIPLKYGVVGQETTGPGGMMKALRTIPQVLEIARDMETICPDAWLINYTNPSGIIAEALGNHSRVKFIGLCSGPKGWISQILNRMGVAEERASVEWVGLNHLGFATRVWIDGRDATAEAIAAVSGNWNIDGEWIRALGAIPCSYLRNYYHRDLVVAENSRPGARTRGEAVKEIETELLRQYADPALSEKPELLKQRGGGGYSDVALAAMESILHNRGDRQITQALNNGAVDGIPANASMELQCVVDGTGAHPLRVGELPLPIRGLVQAVKSYESLVVQAAVEGSPRVALQALMAHPLIPSWGVAKPLLEELLRANRPWLPWA
jgi:6-phospho-beta-glucosidase